MGDIDDTDSGTDLDAKASCSLVLVDTSESQQDMLNRGLHLRMLAWPLVTHW